MTSRKRTAKPPWLKKTLPSGGRYQQIQELVSGAGLHTVCKEAACPNMFECFSRHTATFMILGNRCTRNCGFCNVNHGLPDPPDPEEPGRLVRTVVQMKLGYVVVTSVTRDDLPDGGAAHFRRVIQELKQHHDHLKVEVLIPDFQGSKDDLETVLSAGPDVLNHNLETTLHCYEKVRPGADFNRSLHLIETAGKTAPAVLLKSGLMVGLGEKKQDLIHAFDQLFRHGCRALTIGQYLQPTKNHLPVKKYYAPDEFDHLRQAAMEIGFQKVAAGPFVRSSYHARELFENSDFQS